MKKNFLYWLLLGCFMFFNPQLSFAAAIPHTDHTSANISVSIENNRLPRAENKKGKKAKGIRKNQRVVFRLFLFLAVFFAISAVAMLTMGIIFSIPALWIAATVFVGIMVFMLFLLILFLFIGIATM